MPRKGTHKGARRASDLRKSRELTFKSDAGQAYAVVVSMLGNRRITARCDDGIERMCKIRGSIRRSEWIASNDVILVALRDFEEDKGDVLMRYENDEVRQLRRLGELATLVQWLGQSLNASAGAGLGAGLGAGATHGEDGDDMVVFEDDGEEAWLDFV